MSLLYSDVLVHPDKNGWIVSCRIQYKDVQINRGYHTNGANIPRLLWVFIPPNDPVSFPAVVVHDFLCDKAQYKKADTYLEEILIASDVSTWKRKAIVNGVKFYTKWIR
jgi:hypothetical protein